MQPELGYNLVMWNGQIVENRWLTNQLNLFVIYILK